jgi:hypothetical protein
MKNGLESHKLIKAICNCVQKRKAKVVVTQYDIGTMR